MKATLPGDWTRLRTALVFLSAGLLITAAAACHHTQPAPANGAKPPPARAQKAAPANAHNVLLITLDTTRADHLRAYGNQAAVTPALDALAATGTLFEQAFSSSPQTLPAHATILTGLEPPEHGLRSNGRNRLPDGIPTLASILADRGYRTAAFVAAFVLDSKFGLDRGFATYDDDLSKALPQEVPEELSVYRPGNLVTDAALTWLEGHGSKAENQPPATSDQPPFFAWVHLYDPHYPYHEHSELPASEASYDNEITFMDRQVGRLLSFLDDKGLRRNTLVIAVADHGEGLEDHGEVEHGYLLNEEVLRVPLIISLPGAVREGHRVPAIVSAVDLFPTVLDVLGIDAEPRPIGRSLAAALSGQRIESAAAYAESELPYTVFGWSPLQALTTAEWKYVRSTRPELYDRATDGGELYNLATARRSEVLALEARLASVERRMQPAARTQHVSLSAQDRQRMEALGYSVSDHDKGDPRPAKSHEPSAISRLQDIKDMLPAKQLQAQLVRGLATGAIDSEERLEIARELIRLSPETATFHAHLGDALFAIGKPAEAAGPFAEAAKLQPESASAHIGLGRAYLAGGKAVEAKSALSTALDLEPESAEAHFQMGNVLAHIGELDTALGHYQEALHIDPTHADAHFNIGNTLARRNKPTRAIAAYREALRRRPGFTEAHFNLAVLLAERGESNEAVSHLGEVTRLDPRAFEAYDHLGRILAAQGEADKAREQYENALSIQPGFARSHYNLARLLAESGDCAEADRHYLEALRVHPQEPAFVIDRALLLATCEDTEVRDTAAAIELAEKATELTRRRDALVLHVLSLAYAAAGRNDEAADVAHAALALARAAGQQRLVQQIERSLAGLSTHPDASIGG